MPAPRSRRLQGLTAAVAVVLLACESSTVPVEPSIHATPASIVLEVGEQRTLPVTRVPSSAQFLAVSELNAVATVAQTQSNITITGICEGLITVMLTLPAFPGVHSEVFVEVTDPSRVEDQEPVVCT